MPAPKLKPGEKDGRVRSGRKPKPEEERKAARMQIRLHPDDKAWLMANGGSDWVEARIREARNF